VIVAAAPMGAVAAVAAVVLLVLVIVLARVVSHKRTARRVRQVEESRQAGTLPPDVAHALEAASRRSAGRRPRA
jgi:hypothetical protein